jgi:tRNA dimethylallyltransferase
MVRPDVRVVAVVGPTASGKTAVGLRLARELDGEIVSADSVQLYRGLDVGSAKPTAEERAAAPHHLIDVVDPDAPYTAADFERDASAAIRVIAGRGKVPIIVGGTTLYVRALLHGLCPAPPGDEGIRQRLAERASVEGWPALHAELATLDPDAASRIHPNDRIRIERALEVVLTTGQTLTRVQETHAFPGNGFPAFQIALKLPRELLYERIDRRVLQMFDEGWIEEVESLLERGYDPDLKPLQAIGYRDVVRLVRGEQGREEAVRRIQRDTRRFSKRQMTWLRKEPGVHWHDPREGLEDTLLRRIRAFLEESRTGD